MLPFVVITAWLGIEVSGQITEWPYFGCMPLKENDTTKWDYIYVRRVRDPLPRRNITIQKLNELGLVPGYSLARRLCTMSPNDLEDQRLWLYACGKNGWWSSKPMPPACPDTRCRPLEANVSVHYDYFTMANESGKKEGKPAQVDKSGKYFEHTCVKKICDKSPYKCSAKDKPIFGECIDGQWNFTALEECLNARGCNSDDLFDKLGFERVMVREREGSDSYKDDFVRFYATDTEVSAQCGGETVRLECSNGEWHDPGTKTVHRCTKEGISAL